MTNSPGNKLREAVKEEQPLQVAGAVNAYAAMMAEQVGFQALYVSGAGVANASFGLPDLGITTLQDVLEDIRRITNVTELPLLVDIDTGFGGAFQIARTIKEMQRAGVAAVHMEDQVAEKRCGHRPNKAIVRTEEMVDRIKAAVDARSDSGFVIMARTDALAAEGLENAIDRACRYVEAGADMIFPEAVSSLVEYKKFAEAVQVPILANITEFGKTPLFTIEELREAGVGLALYPLSAFRAMNAAALRVYRAIRQEGTQQKVVGLMQTRAELYDFLHYYDYEHRLDQLFGVEAKEETKEKKGEN
ncbi:methylisocitrate lyase [Paenibacillus glycanilyticus]|uniref:2-methylisocitrate lyase n=1 Tax=Paenibacillus glycanilyticus TaxID=126569 RepID=A0ABQ6GF45_9BACL|nr:methylisocitrate lyase [Paenibacillus glycanilyticus]GLX67946.1 2-methylisocitrate lyase [Paenibacillus glycanilyticus]